MADIKGSALPPDAAPTTDDLMITIDGSGGGTRRITLAQLATLISSNLSAASVSPEKITNPYKYSAYLNAATQSLSAATPTRLAADTEEFDSNNNLDTTTNKGRYTAPIAGYYFMHGRFRTNGVSAGGYLRVSLMKNGAIYKSGTLVRVPGTSQSSGAYSGFLVQLAAGDYIEFSIETDNANAATGGNSNDTWIQGWLVTPT